MTTDPRIEAAAKALYGDVNKSHAAQNGWDEVLPRWQESYRGNARAALAAADKAATITTVEGLAELPQETVIIDKHGDVNQLRGEFWCGYETSPLRTRIMGKYLPARVLHFGGTK